jgi:RimJ/RimL family protein N-acetyltransferase
VIKTVTVEQTSLSTRVRLQDGTTVTLRPIRPEDEPGLIAFHTRLSPDTAFQRFHAPLPQLPANWAHFLANVDYERRMAIVALEGDQLIAVVRYDYSETADEAEVAIVVQDRWQERGLGTILMTELLGYAEARGIHRFRAYVLADNYRMLDMLYRVARVLKRRTEDGVVSLVLTRRRQTEVA